MCGSIGLVTSWSLRFTCHMVRAAAFDDMSDSPATCSSMSMLALRNRLPRRVAGRAALGPSPVEALGPSPGRAPEARVYPIVRMPGVAVGQRTRPVASLTAAQLPPDSGAASSSGLDDFLDRLVADIRLTERLEESEARERATAQELEVARRDADHWRQLLEEEQAKRRRELREERQQREDEQQIAAVQARMLRALLQENTDAFLAERTEREGRIDAEQNVRQLQSIVQALILVLQGNSQRILEWEATFQEFATGMQDISRRTERLESALQEEREARAEQNEALQEERNHRVALQRLVEQLQRKLAQERPGRPRAPAEELPSRPHSPAEEPGEPPQGYLRPILSPAHSRSSSGSRWEPQIAA
mmetsp:Transcript_80872/g.223695  ORF Transcript_80872/g.223695 Transcript_80872/m.223695 type:complete len:362 (+) Transcript_80872:91-1176(+)